MSTARTQSTERRALSSAVAREPQLPIGAAPPESDDTAERLRAFLASIRPRRDVEFSDDEFLYQGRALIEQLAASSIECGMPTLRLTRKQCVTVLEFMSSCEPIDLKNWWLDKNSISHVCGYMKVLQALAESVGALGARQ
jgi:hypothetical protein